MKSHSPLHIFLLPIWAVGIEPPSHIAPADRWAEITGSVPCSTQILIQYSNGGSVRSFTSQTTEAEPSATYPEYRRKAAKKALHLASIAIAGLSSGETQAVPAMTKLIVRTRSLGVVHISINADLGNLHSIDLAAINRAFPDSFGHSLSLTGMTRLQIAIGNEPPADIPVTDGKAILSNVLTGVPQKIRYAVTIGEGEDARTHTYTQLGHRIETPTIALEKYQEWFWWPDEEYAPDAFTYYVVTVTHTPGLDVILEASSDTENWEMIDYASWSEQSALLRSWVPESATRQFFRARTE